MTRKIFYIFNGSMPSKKAYGIQMAKMCEALVESGANLEVILPLSKTEKGDISQYYGLRVHIPTKRLWAPDWRTSGRLGFFLGGLIFMVAYSLYLLKEQVVGRVGVIYTLDMDSFSFVAMPLLGMPYYLETHGGKAKSLRNRFFFKRINGVITINNIIKEQISKTLNIAAEKFLVEPNGIDLDDFGTNLSKDEARRSLSLPGDKKIAMYCGRFYQWKGLEVLVEAAAALPSDVAVYLVGGTADEFRSITKTQIIPPNFVFAGEKKFAEIPQWLAAADLLLVLGTKKDTQSYYYTSPMKMFEYMAVRRPILASSTPALKDIVSNTEALFYEPDSPADLAAKIGSFFAQPTLANDKIQPAYEKVTHWEWKKRAVRVMKFISDTLAYER